MDPISAIVASAPARTAQPWDRQPGESDSAWWGFRTYLAMGELDSEGKPGRRVFARVSEALGHNSRGGVIAWVTEWDWIERASAYDQHIQAQRSAKVVTELEALTERQCALARGMLELAEGGLERLRARGLVATDDEMLSVGQLAQLAKDSVALVRLTHGQSTSNESVRATVQVETVDYSNLSDEELATAKALAAKLRGA